MKKWFVITVLIVLIIFPYIGYSEKQPSPALDIILILDNSGSMKKNDPQFLTKHVVADFLEGLAPDARISIIIFAENSELAMPLTKAKEEGVKDKVEKVLEKVNYRGQYTNIPAAIERGIYELTHNGRKDSELLIIFMTDGVIDTGDRAMDVEKHRWLREELSEEAKQSGIRIFGIAFTDKADFELIQSLGQKTQGGHYRALTAKDIPRVFRNINKTLKKPKPTLEATQQTPTPTEAVTPSGAIPRAKEGFSKGLLIVAIVGIVVLGIIAVFFLTRKTGSEGKYENMTIPDAELVDKYGITGITSHKITKPMTLICRDMPEKNDEFTDAIEINKQTVSGLHAVIEYKDHNFYLTDRGSINGTYIYNNNMSKERLKSNIPRVLKSGDVVAFDQYKFEFKVAGLVSRGGTKIVSPASGGTLLGTKTSAPPPESEMDKEPPEEKPQDVKLHQKHIVIHQVPKAAHLPENNEDEGTIVKEKMCKYHPSYKNTEICQVCHQGRCKLCMKEKYGKNVCEECIKQGRA